MQTLKQVQDYFHNREQQVRTRLDELRVPKQVKEALVFQLSFQDATVIVEQLGESSQNIYVRKTGPINRLVLRIAVKRMFNG